MIKLIYNKLQTSEDDECKTKTVFFSGSTNDISYELKVKGSDESIQQVLDDLKLSRFKQFIEVKIENNQKELSEY